ncbi:MAG: hypothetical protein ABIP63_04310 [Thermoanaerobaculia bacterium]
MIDRISRDQLIELLDGLAAGRIPRAEFRARTPRSTDRGVREIVAQASLLEPPNPDTPNPQRLTGEDRGEIARWILFLESNGDYRWPSLPTWLRVLCVIPSILTFGLIWRPYRRWFEKQGDHRVWPFLDAGELKAARRNRRERA